ncbi:MAG: phosphotransferase [Spirochaetaceae bacterium]|nr:phosphotransferase [Spirochaetaceae bacterium]
MDARSNPIPVITARYESRHRDEAAWRFGFDPRTLVELDGTAFVYEGDRLGARAILKITAGLRDPRGIMGASRPELEAEVDFVRYLRAAGVPVAVNLPSLAGADVEEIPLDDDAFFLAYAFEKAPGTMFPDDDEVEFPDAVLREWGRLFGLTHRLAAGFRPRPGAFRRSWREDDCLNSRALVPASQAAVHARFDEAVARLEAKPRTPDRYGLVHGDLHHGNFLAEGERITLIDFDGTRENWFAAEIATALFNCLPMPRSKTARRREFSLSFLSRLLEGYAGEFAVLSSIVDDLPEFLFLNELLAYGYRYKYWNDEELSRRADYLASIRERIESRAPVVEFAAGDLERLASRFP